MQLSRRSRAITSSTLCVRSGYAATVIAGQFAPEKALLEVWEDRALRKEVKPGSRKAG